MPGIPVDDTLARLVSGSSTTTPPRIPIEDTLSRFAAADPSPKPVSLDDTLSRLVGSSTVAPPAPEQPPLFRPAADIESEMAAKDLEAALPKLNVADELAFYDGVSKIKDPQLQLATLKRGQAKIASMRAVKQGAAERAGQEMARGRPENAGNVIDRLSDSYTLPPGAMAGDLAAMRPLAHQGATGAGQGVRGIMSALDMPMRAAVRTPTAYLFGENKSLGAAYDMSAIDWAKAVRATAHQGTGLKSLLATYASGIPEAAGGAAGATIGLLPTALGVASDIPSLVRGEQTVGDVAKNALETIGGSGEAGADLGVAMAFDPLAWLGFGASGPAKNAARTVMGAARTLGTDEAGSRALAQAVAQAVSTKGALSAGPDVLEAFKAAGYPEQTARRLFGQNLEFLGAAQPELHPPFMSEASVPLATQYGLRKAIGQTRAAPVIDSALSALGSQRAFDRGPDLSQQMVHQARGSAVVMDQESMDALRKELEGLPEGHQLLDKAVREAIYTRHIRPDFERFREAEIPGIKFQPQEQVGNMTVARDRSAILPEDWTKYAGGPPGETNLLRASGDAVRYEDLDKVFGPGAQKYVDIIKRYSERWREQLVQSGYLSAEQAAADPFSGLYLRRPISSVRGPLEEVVNANKRAQASTGFNAIRKPRVGAEEGFPGGLSRSELEQTGYAKEAKTDPNELMADYSRMASRAQAELDLRRRIGETFGQEPGVGAGSAKKLATSQLTYGTAPDAAGQVASKTVEIPAHAANRLGEAFAPTLAKLGSIARAEVGTSTWSSRMGVLAADTADALNSRWKSLVLKSPGYNKVNLMNDTLWMMQDGNKLAPLHIAEVDRLLGNPNEIVHLPSGDITAAEFFKEGAREGLPLPGTAGARFDLDVGKGSVHKLEAAMKKAPSTPAGEANFFDPMTGGGAAGDTLKAALPGELGGSPIARAVSEGVEVRTKFAQYLWRRMQGDAPADAAARANSVLINYTDKNRAQQLLSIGFPFSKYLTAAPGRAMRSMVQNPAAASLIDRTLEEADAGGPVPRQSIAEQGRYVRLGGQGARIATNVMREIANAYDALTVGGPKPEKRAEGIPEGLQPSWTPKLDIYDAFAPIQQAAPAFMGGAGNLDPIINSMRPEARAIAEMALQRDLQRKGDLPAPSLGGLAPRGSVFPEGVQAQQGQNPWATRYASPYLMSRGSLMLGNQFVGMNQPGGPIATLANYRDYMPDEDRRNIYAAQLLSYLIGDRLYGIGPEDALANILAQPEVGAARAAVPAARKADKNAR